MNTVNIEKIACNAVGKYIADCCSLVPYIDENDKTPIWDGNIFIYHSEDICNNNLIGRYPLQVKGMKVSSFTSSTSFSVHLSDLTKFYQEGGCVFFVVQEKWDRVKEETSTKIFYNLLDRTKISSLLVDCETVESKSICLAPTPLRKIVFVEELNTALINKNQASNSIRIAELDELLNYICQLDEDFNQIEDSEKKRSILAFVNSLSSLKCTSTPNWVDKVFAYMRGLICEAKTCIYEYGVLGLYAVFAKFCDSANYLHSAEKYYEIALCGCRKYAYTDPETYMPNVAYTLSNLGNLHVATHDYEKAEAELKEALDLFRGLSKTQPYEFRSFVSLALNNLGEYHRHIKAYQESERELLESLSIIRELNDEQSAFDRACTLNNLGLVYFDTKQYSECIKELTLSLSLYERVNAEGRHIDDKIVMVYNNLGNAYCCVEDFSNAENAYMKSLALNKEMAYVYPQKYNECIVENLINLFLSYQQQEKIIEAKDAISQATDLCRSLYKGNPKQYARLFNHVLHIAVSFYMIVQDHDKVKLHIDEGNNVIRTMHELENSN